MTKEAIEKLVGAMEEMFTNVVSKFFPKRSNKFVNIVISMKNGQRYEGTIREIAHPVCATFLTVKLKNGQGFVHVPVHNIDSLDVWEDKDNG